jgi:hypothetical protein
MPVIDLPGESAGTGWDSRSLPVWSVMLFPEDPERREFWQAAAMTWACAQAPAGEDPRLRLQGFYEFAPALWRLPQAPERVFQDGLRRAPRANLCGIMLVQLLCLARHHQRHCRIERARVLVAEYTDPKVSESLLEKAWPEFKTVSHLWAAQLVAWARLPKEGYSDSWLLRHLGLAEALRREAEAARLLDATETWKLPELLAVPHEGFELHPLSNDKIHFLDRSFPT